jgi:hypothetical protein
LRVRGPTMAPNSNAVRQRRFRQRENAGLIVLPVEMNHGDLVWYLTATYRLDADDGDDRERLATAVTELLADLIAVARQAEH